MTKKKSATGDVAGLKAAMALPPIPQQAPRNRGPRDRTRIRMEISVDQCDEFITMIGERLRTIGVTANGFKPLYTIYHSLKVQRDRISKGKSDAN